MAIKSKHTHTQKHQQHTAVSLSQPAPNCTVFICTYNINKTVAFSCVCSTQILCLCLCVCVWTLNKIALCQQKFIQNCHCCARAMITHKKTRDEKKNPKKGRGDKNVCCVDHRKIFQIFKLNTQRVSVCMCVELKKKYLPNANTKKNNFPATTHTHTFSNS